MRRQQTPHPRVSTHMRTVRRCCSNTSATTMFWATAHRYPVTFLALALACNPGAGAPVVTERESERVMRSRIGSPVKGSVSLKGDVAASESARMQQQAYGAPRPLALTIMQGYVAHAGAADAAVGAKQTCKKQLLLLQHVPAQRLEPGLYGLLGGRARSSG